MTREIEIKSVGIVKVHDGKLRVYRDHNLIAEVELTDPVRKQLLVEIATELRYPPC